jgi:hypothetical protein
VFLAGVPVSDRTVLELARHLSEARFDETADKLEKAWSRETRVLALEVDEREDFFGCSPTAPTSLPS